jgi:phage gp16-like protein
MIAKVKIGQKALGLDDETYRALLQRVAGKRSASELSVEQLDLVLRDMQAKGFKPVVVAGGRKPSSTTDQPVVSNKKSPRADHPSAKKARAMWISLYQLGAVRDRRESALEAFAARQLKVDRLQWADQGQVFKLIEALKAMAERAGWSQDVRGVEDAEGRVVVLKMRLEALLAKKADS